MAIFIKGESMKGYLKPINIFSEIGRLKKVLLHRPGEELENLTPFIMKNFYLMTFLTLKSQDKSMKFLQVL